MHRCCYFNRILVAFDKSQNKVDCACGKTRCKHCLVVMLVLNSSGSEYKYDLPTPPKNVENDKIEQAKYIFKEKKIPFHMTSDLKVEQAINEFIPKETKCFKCDVDLTLALKFRRVFF